MMNKSRTFVSNLLPVKGLCAGDLLKVAKYFKIIQDPFSGDDVTVVKALNPDFAIIHVQEADMEGNAQITGPKYEDVLMSRSSKKVIITAEKITATVKSYGKSGSIDIPNFMVTAVVHAPKGATPCSCASLYDIDFRAIETFKKIANRDKLIEYLAQNVLNDRRGGRLVN